MCVLCGIAEAVAIIFPVGNESAVDVDSLVAGRADGVDLDVATALSLASARVDARHEAAVALTFHVLLSAGEGSDEYAFLLLGWWW